jgi:putative hydrolase of HD superfamily
MYRMSIMCLLFKEVPQLDYSKCVRMALVHDLAESIVGDITPYCGISKKEKFKQEEVM